MMMLFGGVKVGEKGGISKKWEIILGERGVRAGVGYVALATQHTGRREGREEERREGGTEGGGREGGTCGAWDGENWGRALMFQKNHTEYDKKR